MEGLRTERLMLRRWLESDRAVFHRLNSDPEVMRFFPQRMSRAEADATMDRWNADLEADGMSFLAAVRRDDRRIVGVIGLAPVTEPIYDFAPSVQIGWRLLPEAQGHGYATEGARACLAFGFGMLALPEIVSQCVAENVASSAVMERLGLRFRRTFDHPRIVARAHPHLLRHSLHGLRREEWLERA
ncbi:GNAT family N-acetyltransferase [Aureimonas ureilytica]|uniref:GNAT family N-acetyltransferase n=1 Tax=Aureimonas ureilytica TaxID=401562 RepID=UPI0003799B13|nr:GNAT family N-acetyltransferase [Aureimonas ureilytica]